MRLLSLTVEAFVLFRDPFTIPLDKGLILIEGLNLDAGDSADSNGTSKSMLPEALAWVITGKMLRYGNLKLGAEHVCNPDRGLADVRLDAADDNDVIYRFRRWRKTNTSPKLEISVYNVQAGEYQPLSGVSADVARATGDLTAILGFEYDTLRHALFIQGNGLGLAKGGYGGQMAALEAALRFDLFTRAATLATEDRKALMAQDTIARAEIASAANAVLVSRTTIEQIETLDESDVEKELRDEITTLQHEAERWPDFQSQAQVKYLELTRTQEDVASVKATYEAAVEEHQFFSGLQTTQSQACPTCYAPMSEARITDLVTAAEDKIALSEEEIRLAEGRMNAASEAAQAIVDQMEPIKAATRRLPEAKRELAAVEQRSSRRLSVIQQEQKNLDAARTKETKATATVQEIAHKLMHATTWVKGHGTDLKAKVLSESAPVLNEEARKYSELLTDGQIHVEFNPIRQSRTENIMTISGASAPSYDGCSSGERRKIDLILALSLRAVARWRLGQRLNIAVWDEVFDPLDESSLRRAVQILQQDMDELDCVFVVTHNPVLKALFPGAKILRVTREGGVARVGWT